MPIRTTAIVALLSAFAAPPLLAQHMNAETMNCQDYTTMTAEEQKAAVEAMEKAMGGEMDPVDMMGERVSRLMEVCNTRGEANAFEELRTLRNMEH